MTNDVQTQAETPSEGTTAPVRSRASSQFMFED